MNIIIDPNAGPCPGVKRAIKIVEHHLESEKLTAIGPIIHNPAEVERLEKQGLDTIPQNKVKRYQNSIKTNSVFVRSHGISPLLYKTLAEQSTVIDGTCPIVASIQKLVKKYYEQGYQIIIVGKENHPEVLGLNGYCEGNAVIIKEKKDIDNIPKAERYFMVSQTTFLQERFHQIKDAVLAQFPNTEYKDTTCLQVRKRHDNLDKFAGQVDILLLVGGKNSSNTRILYDVACTVNSHTYWIESKDEIKKSWFNNSSTVGITGSASTPVWQLHEIKKKISQLGLYKKEEK